MGDTKVQDSKEETRASQEIERRKTCSEFLLSLHLAVQALKRVFFFDGGGPA